RLERRYQRVRGDDDVRELPVERGRILTRGLWKRAAPARTGVGAGGVAKVECGEGAGRRGLGEVGAADARERRVRGRRFRGRRAAGWRGGHLQAEAPGQPEAAF